jgi:hypothetical protein
MIVQSREFEKSIRKVIAARTARQNSKIMTFAVE